MKLSYTVDAKNLADLYDLIQELLSTTDIPARYHNELEDRFEAIKTKVEAES